MDIIITQAEMRHRVSELQTAGKSVGFVATMGSLHQGHLSLLRRSVSENDVSVCSIFVNRLQFNNPSDIESYPSAIKQDLALLSANQCSIAFIPSEEEMYPEKEPETLIEPELGTLDKTMEAQYRPGHFRGVTTIVSKLFDCIPANRAYFGEKDYQQLAIIKRMTELQKRPIDIVACLTIREDDGLAMSSRNINLGSEQRAIAPYLFKTLITCTRGTTDLSPADLRSMVYAKFREHDQFELEYFEIADSETLVPIESWADSENPRAFIAACLGTVRLIDNMALFS